MVSRISRRLPMNEVTRIFLPIENGDPQAADKLPPLVYDQLRRLAALKLAQEKSNQTLQATALVHEAYLRLVGSEYSRGWDSRRPAWACAWEPLETNNRHDQDG